MSFEIQSHFQSDKHWNHSLNTVGPFGPAFSEIGTLNPNPKYSVKQLIWKTYID
jgi:hypothetical protein